MTGNGEQGVRLHMWMRSLWPIYTQRITWISIAPAVSQLRQWGLLTHMLGSSKWVLVSYSCTSLRAPCRQYRYHIYY